mmetsp:Transcript_52819/g.120224  ORF Transcript_52819/g.120224 Transcript_52819/m.120224 type:complete len:544 (-) Transcript_52819:3-1634(-)
MGRIIVAVLLFCALIGAGGHESQVHVDHAPRAPPGKRSSPHRLWTSGRHSLQQLAAANQQLETPVGLSRLALVQNWSIFVGLIASIGLGSVFCIVRFGLEKHPQAGKPPHLLLFFAGWVTIGLCANYTVILPTAAETARGVGEQLPFSGGIIAMYSVGALAGLAVFFAMPIEKLRLALLIHASVMLVGNLGYTIASAQGLPALLMISRAVVGFEAGVQYHTSLAFVQFAAPEDRTYYVILWQFCLGIGNCLGPMLAGVAFVVGEALDGLGVAPDVYANGLMVIWAIVLILALLLLFPAHWEDVAPHVPTTDAPEDEVVCGEPAQMESEVGSWPIVVTLIATSLVQATQTMLWRSGAAVVFAEVFSWGVSGAGVAMGAVALGYCAAQYIVAKYLVQYYDSCFLMRCLLGAQIAGCFLLAGPETAEVSSVWKVFFSVGSVVAWSANALWGGVALSLCLGRAKAAGSWQSTTGMLLVSQICINLGNAVGATASRMVLQVWHSQIALASVMGVVLAVQLGIQIGDPNVAQPASGHTKQAGRPALDVD